MRGRFFQDRVGLDHLLRDQVASDRKVLQGALRLCAPQLVRWDRHFTEAVGFNTKVTHLSSSLVELTAWVPRGSRAHLRKLASILVNSCLIVLQIRMPAFEIPRVLARGIGFR